MTIIAEKTWEELRNLTITRVYWYSYLLTLGSTLNVGQSYLAGTRGFNNDHTFDPTKKITRIECIFAKNEQTIYQINFYHHQQRLVAVGINDDLIKAHGGRREVFEIGEDEQLIGCKLYQNMSTINPFVSDEKEDGDFVGITFIKMKVKI